MLISNKKGKIKKIDYSKVNDPDLVYLSFDYKEGEIVPEFTNKTDRIGHIIVKGKSAEEAKEKLQGLIEQIEIILE